MNLLTDKALTRFKTGKKKNKGDKGIVGKAKTRQERHPSAVQFYPKTSSILSIQFRNMVLAKNGRQNRHKIFGGKMVLRFS